MTQSDSIKLFETLTYLQATQISVLRLIPVFEEDRRLRRFPPEGFPYVEFMIRRSFMSRSYLLILRPVLADLSIELEGMS